MRIRKMFGLGGAVCALVAALGLGVAAQGEKKKNKHQADIDAIHQSSDDFVKAFTKKDAKALANLWTEQGECHEASGEIIVGRANLEKAFASFFEHNPRARIEVHIDTIRFPAPDLAIEEGLLRQILDDKDLPSTTVYSAIHVRQQGQWKIAVSQESGAGQDRLEDLDWLIGTWQASLKDQEVTLSFAREKQKPFLRGEFTKKSAGKVVSAGLMKIGIDPKRGQLRSWHFDDDGGHGQALWIRDRSNWVLDSHGVQADGTETGALNILGRLNNNEFTWRSIDRVLGDRSLPDTPPVKLNRVQTK